MFNLKKLFICLLAIIVSQTAFVQDTSKVIISSVKQNEQDLKSRICQYPQFVPGKAIFKNGTVTETKLNYSYFTNNILFINPKGDTLELSQADNFNAIIIGTDTFRYYKKKFFQQLTHYSTCNLFIGRSLKYNGSEKKGAYGSYSATTAVTTYNSFTANLGSGYMKLLPDENALYIFQDDYYFSGKFNQFYPATKKGVYELFSKNQKQLKDFLRENKIDFDKKEDLEKLIAFAQTILK
jgi:hypothetical protein